MTSCKTCNTLSTTRFKRPPRLGGPQRPPLTRKSERSSIMLQRLGILRLKQRLRVRNGCCGLRSCPRSGKVILIFVPGKFKAGRNEGKGDRSLIVRPCPCATVATSLYLLDFSCMHAYKSTYNRNTERQHYHPSSNSYRFLSSKRQCLKSIFRIHNETCNIWTHMLGLLGLIILALHIHTTVLGKSPTTTIYDHFVFLFFFVAASECLISSTLYHTFLCHSRLTVMRCAATFDYIGIGVLITASVMATLHYGFFCDTTERWMFLSFSGGMGIIGCIIPFYPKFDLPSFRYFRIFIFLGMACSGIIPITYAGLQKGWSPTWKFIQPFIKSGLAYLTGLVFYGHRFPERQFPGWFDRWGHSHQLWHVAVVAGIYYHYLAMAHFFEARYSFGCLAVYGGYDHPSSLHS